MDVRLTSFGCNPYRQIDGGLALVFVLAFTCSLALCQKLRIHGVCPSKYYQLRDAISRYDVRRLVYHRTVSPPCEQIVRQAEKTNRQNNHENLGCLSFEAAFSPRQLPLKALPQSHKCWDQIAAELPVLVRAQCLRDAVDQMPLLSAAKHSLDDRYLHRAASVLGILAHAYVRLDGETSLTTKYRSHSEILPDSLHIPWAQVCDRLGRTSTLLTFADFILHNFTTSADTVDSMTLENSELLIPTVNNREEQIFYGTMIETNAKTVPVIREIIEAQRSVLMDDRVTLSMNISRLIVLVRAIMKVTIAKISTNASKDTYMDPVVWTKTVANLAVPWLDNVTGPAGTAHPFFHMIDEFTGRTNYNTRIGAEARRIRADYPVHWRQFLNAINKVSVASYIADTNDPKLRQLWQSFNNVYSGDEGLLGFHRRKVYGFLSVSFRVGRNSTINGLGQRQGCQKWQEADEELEAARQERNRTKPFCPAGFVVGTTNSVNSPVTYSVHELIQHNSDRSGFWFSAQGYLYDATMFLSSHPGGRQVIALVSGQDASSDLAAVAHLSDPKIKAMLERCCIGSVRKRRFTSMMLQNFYDLTVRLGFKLAEAENIYAAAVQLLERRLTSADQPGDLDPLKVRYFTESSVQLRDTQAPSLITLLQEILDLLYQAIGSKTEPKDSCTEHEGETDAVSCRYAQKTLSLTRDEMTAVTECNRQNLAAIKAICVRLLVRIQSYPSDTSDIKSVCDSCVDDVREASKKAKQLGR